LLGNTSRHNSREGY